MMSRFRPYILRSFIASSVLTVSLLPAADLDFYQDVYPFLKTNCISCHNKTTTKADLDMETPEAIKKGGESGPGLIPGKSTESLIVLASLHQEDMEMPPAKNKSGAMDLTQAEIAKLKLWIDQGAKSSVKLERAVAWQPLAAGVHPIYSVAMTQDGRYAACGRSNQIFMHDLATRQFTAQLTDGGHPSGTAHRALVQALAFSPDGKRLASGSFREVKIWRLENTPEPGGQTPAAAPAAPADEALVKKMAVASKATILTHALSAEGKQLVAGCADGLVRVWDIATGKIVCELRGNLAASQQMAALDWTLSVQMLEQTFHKAETTRIETQNKALDELLKKANEAIVAMKKVLPEKQKLLKPATEAKAAAQKTVDELTSQMASASASRPDAAATKQLKDAQDKLLTATTAENSAQAAISATENNVKDAEEEVKRISGSKAQNAKDITATNAAIEASKKIQDKATADLAVIKKNLSRPDIKPLAVAFSADAQRVAAIFADGTLNVWGIASGMATEQVRLEKPVASASLAAHANGSFQAITPNGNLTTSNTPHWILERTLGGSADSSLFADRVNAVRFSSDGKTLATGGGELSRSGDVILFDVASGKAVKTWKELHEDAVLCLDFSPDGKSLASGASDKIAKITDVATGRQTRLFEGHTHHVMGTAFRADGRVLATAGADGVVMIWDVLMGERKKKIEGWTKEVTSLQFIGATKQIITSAGDNLVRVVNDDGTQVRSIANLPDFMQGAASTPNGSTFIAGGEDSQLRLWEGGTGKEITVFTDK